MIICALLIESVSNRVAIVENIKTRKPKRNLVIMSVILYFLLSAITTLPVR